MNGSQPQHSRSNGPAFAGFGVDGPASDLGGGELHELLAGRVIEGDPGESVSREHLKAGMDDARVVEEEELLELAAAAIMVAEVEGEGASSMPDALTARVLGALESAGRDATATGETIAASLGSAVDSNNETASGVATSAPSPESAPGSKLFASLGWLAAAAAIGVAAIVVSTSPAPTQPATPEQALAELESKNGTISWEFQPWANRPDAPGYEVGDVSGRVVWNSDEQRGYMVFEGLPPNDPRRAQYQLWIVVPEDEQGNPIDGGVFDVAQTDGEVIVPIDAKLAVENPQAFGVTVEKPGGVVVSDQDRRAIVAVPPSSG